MNKSQRIKQKKLIRHKKRRKNRSSANTNPIESAVRERTKQLLKSAKIKAGKIDKEDRKK